MSEEGDSPKITPSEGKENAHSEDNTDSSQDEVDVKDKSSAKEKQNNVDKNDAKEEDDDKDEENDKEGDTEESESQDSKSSIKEKESENDTKKTLKKETKKKENDKVKSEDDEGSDENEEDASEEEEKEQKKKPKEKKGKNVPLLDQPLEQSGKRERKNVSRLKEDKKEAQAHDDSPDVKSEKACLGDIPRIDASISRFKNDDLKLLHKLLYKEPGKTNMIKKNIRKFDGFDFTKDSDEYSKKIKEILKFESKQLKVICEMLDLSKSEKDDENANKILEFLLEPKDSGKVVGGGRPKRTAAVRANNRGYSSHDDYSSDEKYKARSRRDKTQRATYKEDSSSSDEEFQLPEEEHPPAKSRQRGTNKRKKQKSDESEDELATPPSSDESDEASKKRKRAPKVNSKSKAKTPVKKVVRKPAPKKTPGRKKKVSSEEEDELSDKKNDGSSSEDEPLVKKTKSTQPPTDEEIKTFVKEILEGANLEEITMKTVCQKVYAHYPDFDLAHKKDFIKATVKSLIST